jgi:hypothetical protein
MGKLRRWWRRRDWDQFRGIVLFGVLLTVLGLGPETSKFRVYPPGVRFWSTRVFIAFGAILNAMDFYFFLTRPDGSKDQDGNPLGLSILPRRDKPAERERSDQENQSTTNE